MFGKRYRNCIKKESRNKELTQKDLMNFLMKRFKFDKKKAIDTMKKAGFDISMLKKESTKAYADTLNKIANDKKMKMISKKDKALLTKIAKLMKKQKSVKLRGKSGMGTISHFGMPESVDEGKYSKIMKAVSKGPK